MKKLTLLFFAIITALSVNSQITITSDNAPEIGDALPMIKIFEPESVSQGDAGENIIWDFSANVEDNPGAQTFNYINPAGLPEVNNMNNPDMAEQINSDENGYFYFGIEATDNDWVRHGFWGTDGSTELWASYTTPLKMYDYPFTYESSYINDGFTATGMFGDYPMEFHDTHYGYDCDAYGTLILPHRTFPNAVRLHITETFTMAADIGLGSYTNVATVTDDSYFWFAEGVEGPIMSLTTSETEDLIGGSGTSTEHSARWYHEAAPTEITVDFAANQLTGDTYTTFNFYNGSNPTDGSTFLWEFTPNTVTFEDGTDATSIHPKVKFTQAGTYTVALTTTNSNFTPDAVTETKVDYITVTAAPELVVDFSTSNLTPDINDIITLTSAVSVSTGGSVAGTTTYQWNVLPVSGWEFANFTTATDENPDVMFTASGCYHVQLIVTNSEYPNSPVTVTKMNYISCAGGCGSAYTVTFTVADGTTPIDGAEITVTGYSPITTNSSGEATIDLVDGDYDFGVTATGYGDYTGGTFTVDGADLPVGVSLTPTSVNQLNSTIKVYPNPSSGIFTIKLEESSNVSIINISGKQIYTKNNILNSVIDISNCSKGIYFLKISNSKLSTIRKIIIK